MKVKRRSSWSLFKLATNWTSTEDAKPDTPFTQETDDHRFLVENFNRSLNQPKNDYQFLATTFYPSPDVYNFWQSFVSNAMLDGIHQQKLFDKVAREPVPAHLRDKVWICLTSANPKKLSKLYDQLKVERSKYESIIRLDISRTYPNHEMFQEGEPGLDRLFNVLKAYSNYDPEVGYCQGLSFLLSELSAFAVLIQLMGPQTKGKYTSMVDYPKENSKYNIRKLYTPDLSGLHSCLSKLNLLIERYLPKVSKHFEKLSVSPSVYACQWFLTCFSYSLPVEIVDRLFDIMFVQGIITTLMCVALALINKNQDILLEMTEMEQIVTHLKNNALDAYGKDPNQLIEETVKLGRFVSVVI